MERTRNDADVVLGILRLLALPVGLVVEIGDGFAKGGDCSAVDGEVKERSGGRGRARTVSFSIVWVVTQSSESSSPPVVGAYSLIPVPIAAKWMTVGRSVPPGMSPTNRVDKRGYGEVGGK